MKCEPIDLGNGVTGFVCGRRTPRKRCSCGELTELLCDYPVARNTSVPQAPMRGDARTNIHNGHVFYVWDVKLLERTVIVATGQPSFKAIPRTALVVHWSTWFERTLPGCDRPVCRRCVTRWKSLDFCAPHGRLHAKELA